MKSFCARPWSPRRRAAGPGTALADVNIGVTLSLTGPASGLGIPVSNQFKLWPQTIAGEKVNLIILDDASDPGKGVSNARRFVTDDKVDMIFGGSITTVSAAIAPVASRSQDDADRRSRRWACRPSRSAGSSACRRASP